MFGFFKEQDNSRLYSPVDGAVYPLSETQDKAFASGQLGEGVVFRFDGDCVVSPCSGTVAAVPGTKHSVCLLCDNGAELLIHIGVDTVMLGGAGFKMLVSKGQRVRRGQKLIRVDRSFMQKKGIDLATPMVILNSDEVEISGVKSSGEVSAAKTEIMICKKTAED